MEKHIICISRTVPIEDFNAINNLIAQGWSPVTNHGDVNFMTVKLSKTFTVETYDQYEFDLYLVNLKQFYMDFNVEWWDKAPTSDK